MDYIVNGKVVVTLDGMKTVGAVETEIYLSSIPMRLLRFLIENNGIELSKDDIFNTVWNDHGLIPSGSSLSQHISKLRKCFRQFDIDDEIIKTLPQKGIVFSATVDTASEIPKQTLHKGGKTGSLKILICTTLVLSMVFLIFFVIHNNTDDIVSSDKNYASWHRLGKLQDCIIFSAEKEMTDEFRMLYLENTKKFILSQKIRCRNTDKILVDLGAYGSPVNQELVADRQFYSFCQLAGNEYQCDSFYYSVGVTQ